MTGWMHRSVTEVVCCQFQLPWPKLGTFNWQVQVFCCFQVLCAFLAYQFAKFACKVKIQHFSFSAALTLVMPVLVVVLWHMCSKRNDPNAQCSYRQVWPWLVAVVKAVVTFAMAVGDGPKLMGWPLN